MKDIIRKGEGKISKANGLSVRCAKI